MENLYQRLNEYAAGPAYPLHMPGHKRRAFGIIPPEFTKVDITEIDGFDNLHDPEGILKDMQQRAADLYGADSSFCLVGGSTCGILSAISAALPEGGHLLMARNCHKSAYHGAYLRRQKVTYLWPETEPDFGICEAIKPEQVLEALEKEPDIGAVLIVSPTYEGRISPVREIAKIVHEHHKILIVDEAHGAHLGMGEKADWMPENSVSAGADLVIHSIHKTLPALTQTALLHVSGNLVDRRQLVRFLRIYQSSSPSYLLMAGIDNCLQVIANEGNTLFREFYHSFYEMMEKLENCRNLRFLAALPDGKGGFRNGAVQDVGKLSVNATALGLNGYALYQLLRTEYELQPEMAAGEFCLLMFTVGDSEEGYRRTINALLEIDNMEVDHEKNDGKAKKPAVQHFEEELRCAEAPADKTGQCSESGPGDDKVSTALNNPCFCPPVRMPVWEAWDSPCEAVALDACCGKIAAEFVNLYPPGIPIVAPGEELTEEICQKIKEYIAMGLQVQGMADDCVKVVGEKKHE